MPITEVLGPPLIVKTRYGSEPSSVPSFEITKVKSTASRKKPTSSLIDSMTSYVRESARTTRSVNTDYLGYTWASYYSLGRAVIPTNYWSDAERIANDKLRSKLKDETFNASVFIGELPETLKWMTGTAHTLLDMYRAFKRLDLDKMRRTAKSAWKRKGRASRRALRKYSLEASKRWLEWRYAVTPLMADMDALLKELYARRTSVLQQRHAAGHMINYSNPQKNGSMSQDSWATAVGHVTKGCYVTVSPDAAGWKRMGLLNPLAALWELTPLSFIFDWFIPVGDYLASLDCMIGVDTRSSWLSRKEEGAFYLFEKRYPAWGQGPPPNYGFQIIGWNLLGPQKSEFKNYFRTVPSPISLPTLKIEPSMTTNRWFDTAALLRGTQRYHV